MSRTAAIFNATNMLAAECERLERERDEARAEVERLWFHGRYSKEQS